MSGKQVRLTTEVHQLTIIYIIYIISYITIRNSNSYRLKIVVYSGKSAAWYVATVSKLLSLTGSPCLSDGALPVAVVVSN